MIDRCVGFLTHKQGEGKFEGCRFMLDKIEFSLKRHKAQTIFLQSKVVSKELQHNKKEMKVKRTKKIISTETEIIAMVIFNSQQGYNVINYIAVAQQYRKKGIAKLLIHLVQAVSLHLDNVTTWYLMTNTFNKDFYANLGFEVIDDPYDDQELLSIKELFQVEKFKSATTSNTKIMSST